MRHLFITIWLGLIAAGIGYLFWYNEWKYTLPTPIPKHYQAVNVGEHINLPPQLNCMDNKPVFLHFFNPACPCSRFNIPHFKSLVKQYGDKISFAIVVMSKDKKYTSKEIQDKFDVNIPILFDTAIAAACGVYSTPQAVLLDAGRNLYYRGNYNKSRYCLDTKSNFAQIAIDTLLNNKSLPVFRREAFKAYGCELPVCKK